jgi:hypothetical protein
MVTIWRNYQPLEMSRLKHNEPGSYQAHGVSMRNVTEQVPMKFG